MLRFEWHLGADRGQREVFGAEAVGISSTRMVWPIQWRRWRGCSAIDFSAVPDFDDLDQSLVIVYGIDDTIITLSDAI